MGQEQKKVCKERSHTAQGDTWDLTMLYPDFDAFDRHLTQVANAGTAPRWPAVQNKGESLADPLVVKNLFDAMFSLESSLDKLYTYAHLRHDEDVADDRAKKAFASALSLMHAFREEIAWIDPALLQLPKETLDALLDADELQKYRVFLRKIFRLKPYTLDAPLEKILALAGRALDTGQKAFGSLNNADLRFASCRDSKGEVYELTHGSYHVYMRGKDRTLRKESFLHLHQAFAEHQNTLCELLQGQVQRHVFIQKARGFSSCLEAALYPYEVDVAVYKMLLAATRNKLSLLHDYIAYRKQWLKVEELHVYDLAVSVVEDVTMNFSYEEAVEGIIASVAPLGQEYQDILRKGLTEERWVDRYENKRKRSGAYSSGCYGSPPYILMNYQGTLQDIMTLTHEAGHSMHSYFSRKHQTYQDSQYPIFLAEVASTFHEELLFQYLLRKVETNQEKAYLINQKIDAVRNTFFRQVLFAEFEWKIHEWVEEDKPLTPASLQELYMQLNKEYFGDALTLDPELAHEWSRIPHFYYNFYVYQYATGISAAHVLAKKVLSGDSYARDSYQEFLSSGGSLDPLSTLRRAGVDMAESQVIDLLLADFQDLVSQLTSLVKK
ncbi:MAG: oligoendopeptidase F [Chlamydiae bacterium]|nr:oligoendopeptidase F [Chlamydiota bacterium]